MSSLVARTVLLIAIVAGFAASGLADDADDQFAQAANQYAAKHWDQAVTGFRDFLHEYPANPKRGKAMYFEGEALMQLNRHAEAYPLFVDLLDEQPTGPYAKQALFRAAETAVASGKNAEAEIRLSQFQAQYAGDKLNANILLFRGELALHIGDQAASAQWYNASLEKFPDAPIADECRLRLAHVLELQKHSDAAEEQIRAVAEHDHTPWSEMALLQLAARQLAANHPQAALEQYEAIEKAISKFVAIAANAFRLSACPVSIGPLRRSRECVDTASIEPGISQRRQVLDRTSTNCREASKGSGKTAIQCRSGAAKTAGADHDFIAPRPENRRCPTAD